jgi:ankyrin repeat protein
VLLVPREIAVSGLISSSASDETSRIPPEVQTFLERPEVFFDDLAVVGLCKRIATGDLSAVHQYLAMGLSVDVKGRSGVTPLLWSYKSRQFTIFSLLLEKGANPDVSVSIPVNEFPAELAVPYTFGDSVFYMAVRNRVSAKWVDSILAKAKRRQWVHPDGGGDVLHAFFGGSSPGVCRTHRVLDELIRFGLDLDLEDEFGFTPLRLAVRNQEYGFATRLLKAGASAECYYHDDYQLIHFLASSFRNQSGSVEASQESQGLRVSDRQKEWDELLGILREKGFSLTEALKDLERAEDSGSKQRYMRQRRIRREDRFSCESGREFRESLEDDPDFEDPLGEIMPRDCMAAPVN